MDEEKVPPADARSTLHRLISERRPADFHFESADGSFVAKIQGFIGRNAVGELLIAASSSRTENLFVMQHALDFTCDYSDLRSRYSEASQAVRLRFKNGDVLLITEKFLNTH